MNPSAKVQDIPRLPLEGHPDLTYRCNNHCLHCWLRLPSMAERIIVPPAVIDEIAPVTDRKQIWCGLLATLIRSMVTAEWWEKELDVLQKIVPELPCYAMHFDRSGVIVIELERMTEVGVQNPEHRAQ